ncbi:heparitin sulfate lyase [Niabella ginsenosidivorans]|uniref:Heparitin sulfate lyase n=1 Tax=Niabella ginsenosidivorans TaxID=1176587 RepID=A0A1A9I1C0_9BACT|nr:heparin lyase I family protein [Niabella ginsenosidivorans]ANH80501.1 heparitin sulfate lyase [Niabella ginsenosidivorans]
MIKKRFIAGVLLVLAAFPVFAQNAGTDPVTTRVNVQADSAREADIIDGEWVAVGINRPYSIQKDAGLPFEGRPSYRFELKTDDNSLQGYEEGSTKGRAELCYCYATADDYKNLPPGTYATDQVLKLVYNRGKGQCPQGSKWAYRFSVFIPSSLPEEVNTIFAQWHGMPSRTLVQDPSGKVMQLTPQQFVALSDSMIFEKDLGHEKIAVINKNGKQSFKAGKKNGWKVEQGGYPPLAFGFSDGMFYIKANSDSRWMTDKTDRTLASPGKVGIMQSVSSAYKTSTIAYKMPFAAFPKDTWVTFDVAIDWSVYGGANNKVEKPGMLDVVMHYQKDKKPVNDHIVNNQKILIGRNDENGYYFKFGIYRVGSNTAPVVYNLADFSQKER